MRRAETFGRALRSMRRLTVLALAGLLASTSPAATSAEARAVVSGRVVDGSGRPVPGALVRLLSARPGAANGEREMRTDADGRFRFGRLTRGAGVRYALEAEFDGGLFVDETFRLRSNNHSEDVEVWQTTSDPSVIRISRNDVFIAHDDGDAGVIESVTVTNASDRAYVGRSAAFGGEGGPGSPTLGFSLPPQAIGRRVDIVSSDLDRLYATTADFGFAATVAIPPSRPLTTIFAYGIEHSGGVYDVSRRVLYPTRALNVYVTDPLEVNSNRLTYEGPETIEGRTYDKWTSSGGFDAGDTISLSLVAEGTTSTGLWVGGAIALGVIATALAVAFLVGRRRAGSRAASVHRSEEDRSEKEEESEARASDDVLVEIAELDLLHQAGDVSDADYDSRRADLKRRALVARRRERVE